MPTFYFYYAQKGRRQKQLIQLNFFTDPYHRIIAFWWVLSKGLKVREDISKEDEPDDSNLQNQEIEKDLGIDIEDPNVIKATTTLQAGFRGAQTRKKLNENQKNNEPKKSDLNSNDPPEIVVDQAGKRF